MKVLSFEGQMMPRSESVLRTLRGDAASLAQRSKYDYRQRKKMDGALSGKGQGNNAWRNIYSDAIHVEIMLAYFRSKYD